ncbi:uncharacterized protein A1O5_02702 [Cladophialophora psammophila CBS 110553]|uniref:Uncharacterized protein n=1 Tax=Cladophialophora psammophila CBS 110553 TaxID=1182543 RepID=W9XBX0_9EURO|nr:uncharacterized protein A1O5_02702 [Cladophialophora psammophila CBS 110553]EXJ74406.1 hypothetical protein A1O5_02702 [Cladophialophora psammophila CBS 110553]
MVNSIYYDPNDDRDDEALGNKVHADANTLDSIKSSGEAVAQVDEIQESGDETRERFPIERRLA